MSSGTGEPSRLFMTFCSILIPPITSFFFLVGAGVEIFPALSVCFFSFFAVHDESKKKTISVHESHRQEYFISISEEPQLHS